ncbi:MAG TPA: DNA-formamidopyrimidine glycosylase family protein [Steroidobacteraceae bacterium]|nr:DNA-formamidopyrimidine glycosylase family protein [Steroidobacteraceae bacterium]
MPELPDITVYVEALEQRIGGARLESVRITHPFLLRSFEPSLEELQGRRVMSVKRVGKRVALQLEGDRWLVFHLMIAGRLHWFARGTAVPRKRALAYAVFESGTLTLTEAGSKRRAALYVFASSEALAMHDPGGLEILESSYEQFRASLCRENHTLKRSLTDPHTFSGIGNAYSDEILHRARLSPVALTQKLDEEGLRRLFEATRTVLSEWTQRLRDAADGEFPEKVTAFRPEMAVHGRFGKPCPVCATRVQRIRYAENETNYCPRCQTGGRILADRSLSRLLKDDWPRTIEELEV